MGCAFCEDFKAWWNAPFKADMDVKHWALFVLLVIVLFAGWGFVFRHIRGFEA
jgi:hypothetical protein